MLLLSDVAAGVDIVRCQTLATSWCWQSNRLIIEDLIRKHDESQYKLRMSVYFCIAACVHVVLPHSPHLSLSDTPVAIASVHPDNLAHHSFYIRALSQGTSNIWQHCPVSRLHVFVAILGTVLPFAATHIYPANDYTTASSGGLRCIMKFSNDKRFRKHACEGRTNEVFQLEEKDSNSRF